MSGCSGTTGPHAHCSRGTSAWTGGYSVGGPFSVFGSTTSTAGACPAGAPPPGLAWVGCAGTLSGRIPGLSGTACPQAHWSFGRSARGIVAGSCVDGGAGGRLRVAGSLGGPLSGRRPGFSGTYRPHAHWSLGTSGWTGGYSVGGPDSGFAGTTSTGGWPSATVGDTGLFWVGAGPSSFMPGWTSCSSECPARDVIIDDTA